MDTLPDSSVYESLIREYMLIASCQHAAPYRIYSCFCDCFTRFVIQNADFHYFHSFSTFFWLSHISPVNTSYIPKISTLPLNCPISKHKCYQSKKYSIFFPIKYTHQRTDSIYVYCTGL